MPRLTCPHCQKPVAANPIGRWYARFLCPHCRGKLQFDPITNAIGLGGSAFFFVMMYAAITGQTPMATRLAIGAGVLWVGSVGLSYAIRRVVKG